MLGIPRRARPCDGAGAQPGRPLAAGMPVDPVESVARPTTSIYDLQLKSFTMTPPLTRRKFLASASAFAATALVACGGGGGGVSTGLGGSDLPLSLEPDPNRRLTRVQREDFERVVGAYFRMSGEAEGDVVNVSLAAVVDARTAKSDATAAEFREPFLIRLRGPEGRLARDGTYALNHPAIGDLDVFVVYGGTVEEIDANGERTPRSTYLTYFS
jgi:hypothetical protein